MPIKIENQHFFTLVDCFLSRNRDIVKQAKSMCFISKSMVSGWADQGKVALFHRFHGDAHSSSSSRKTLVGSMGVSIQLLAGFSVVFDFFNVLRWVDERHILLSIGYFM